MNQIQMLQRTVSDRNNRIRELEQEVEALTDNLNESNERVSMLEDVIRHMENGGEGEKPCCQTEWVSIGTDPETGDKLKKCGVCGNIGVR